MCWAFRLLRQSGKAWCGSAGRKPSRSCSFRGLSSNNFGLPTHRRHHFVAEFRQQSLLSAATCFFVYQPPVASMGRYFGVIARSAGGALSQGLRVVEGGSSGTTGRAGRRRGLVRIRGWGLGFRAPRGASAAFGSMIISPPPFHGDRRFAINLVHGFPFQVRCCGVASRLFEISMRHLASQP